MDAFSFDSLQGVPGAGGGPEVQNFPDFSQFGFDGDAVHVTGGVQFDIPPLPLSPDPENFHIVGGVSFEMPPLPDFSPDDELEIVTTATETSAASSDLAMTPNAKKLDALTIARSDGSSDAINQHSVSGQYSGSKLVKSSAPFLSNSTQAPHSDQNWSADFEANNFSTVRRMDQSDATRTNMTNDSTGGSDEFGSSSSKPANKEGNDFGGFQVATITSSADDEFGEFGGFSSNSGVTNAPKHEEAGFFLPPPNVAGLDISLETSSSESLTKAVDTNSSGGVVAVSNSATAVAGGNEFGGFSGEGTFGGFSAITVTDSFPSSNSILAATSGGDNFGPFASSSSKTGECEEFGDLSSSFVVPVATAGGGGLEGFSSNSARTEGADEFGGFSSGPVATTASEAGGDNFKGFSSGTTTTTASGNDFGSFSGAPGNTVTSSEQGFAAFSSTPPRVTTRAPRLPSADKVCGIGGG